MWDIFQLQVYIDRKLPVGVSVSEYIIGVEFLCNEYTVEQVFNDKFLSGKLYTTRQHECWHKHSF